MPKPYQILQNLTKPFQNLTKLYEVIPKPSKTFLSYTKSYKNLANSYQILHITTPKQYQTFQKS